MEQFILIVKPVQNNANSNIFTSTEMEIVFQMGNLLEFKLLPSLQQQPQYF